MDLSDSDSSDPLSPYSRGDHPFADNTPTIHLPIESRLSWSWRLFALMCFAMAAFWFFAIFKIPSKPSDKSLLIIVGVLGALLAAYGVWLTLEALRGGYRADENGLSWRRALGDWKSIRWEDVTDYYRTSPVNNSGMIETRGGKVELSYQYAGIERIADLVIEKTPHIHNMGWEMRGTRSTENWSRSFSQKFLSQLTIVAMLTAFQIMGCKFFIDSKAPANVRITGIIVLTVGYALPLVLRWRDWLFAIQHRDQKLTFNAQGLSFTSSAHSFEVKWREITKISLLPKVKGITPVQIETTTENFIVWNITENHQWLQIKLFFEQYAARALKAGEPKNKKWWLF